MDLDGNKRVFNRLGPSTDQKNQKVCSYWRAGNCNRFPCQFLHQELPFSSNGSSSKRPHGFSGNNNNNNYSNSNSNLGNSYNNYGGASSWGGGGRGRGRGRGGGGGRVVVPKVDKLCNFWVQGSCNYGDRCKYLHSWCSGECFALLTQLEGHQKCVTGISMPAGSDKLYSGSKDETVRVWDCQSGQCASVINLGGEVGCMLSEGPWLFVGLPNIVKAWNTQTNAELSLGGPVGQVYALVAGNDLLFAGTQDGTILAWRFNTATNNFEPAASLKGHTLTVVTLVVGGNRIYSGSMDKSIKVWSLETLQCIQTLSDHTSVVMSLLCWDQFLLSCSLDNTIKVWVATEGGNLEATYTHKEDHGLLKLCGMHDFEAKPVLLCSCNDNCVRTYDLPSFSERGKIYAKQEVRTMQIGPGGLFFTGDGTGQVRVWNWLAQPAVAV